MKKKYASLVMAGLLTLGVAGLANAATTIMYAAVDLADTTVGEDLWRYTYTVSGDSFATGTGFAIQFEETDYTLSGALVAPNPDWDVQTYGSPYNPGSYVYDAYALVNNASLADRFVVDFVWTGGSQGPGSQYFVVYDSLTGTLLGDGCTSPVPVPAAAWLLGSGLVAVAGLRKKSRKA